MSLKLSVGNAHLAIFGYGWDDEVIDSGDGGTEDGSVIQDISDSLDYDFGDMDWDAIADEIGIDINDGYYVDEDGTIYTDDDGDGIYTDEYGNEYGGDGDYNPYGYYEDPDGIPYYDYDGDGIYTDEYGNEYDGDGDYHPYDYYVDIDGNYYYDYDGDGIYTDEYGNEYDGNGEYVESGVLQNKIDQELSKLANDEEALYECMTDHGDSEGIPARIIVTNPPDTVEYNDGDNIDFTGIVVCAYSSATARTPFIRQEWDGPHHNQIPFDQLTFPETIASSSGDVKKVINTKPVLNISPFTRTIEIGSQKACVYTNVNGTETLWEIEIDEDSIGVFFTRATASFGIICASRTKRAVVFREYRTEGENGERQLFDTYYAGGVSTHYGKTAYYSYVQMGFAGVYKLEGDFLNVQTSISDYSSSRKLTAERVGWTLLWDERIVSIPVLWQTDYQTEAYEDTFDITVT